MATGRNALPYRPCSALSPIAVLSGTEKNANEIADLLSKASVYVWPGHGEAYGLAYLEAQAAGLPVIAEAVAGVPEVVKSGTTGLLTPENDTAAYAGAIETLLGDDKRREDLARAARQFVKMNDLWKTPQEN